MTMLTHTQSPVGASPAGNGRCSTEVWIPLPIPEVRRNRRVEHLFHLFGRAIASCRTEGALFTPGWGEYSKAAPPSERQGGAIQFASNEVKHCGP